MREQSLVRGTIDPVINFSGEEIRALQFSDLAAHLKSRDDEV